MDVKKLVFDLVGCKFTGPIEEIEKEGLYVKYDGKSAVIGGESIPAKARAYMLLAKAIAEGKESYEVAQKPNFSTIGPMLDMSRSGVMTVESVKKYLDYTAVHGMNMFMLYTEETYEVEGYPYFGYQRGRYTLKELQEIDDYAYSLGIEVIPCIQTLGHMSQYLRWPTTGPVKDHDNELLVGAEETYDLIRACISTVRKAFRSNRIHIGCDEARMLGLGKYLRLNGYHDRFDLFNQHLERVTAICREYGYHPMMWSDMYYDIADKNKTEGYATYVEVPQYAIDAMPDCDMVFWDYYNSGNDFYRINIEKHNKFNRKILFAGGIWTWDGFIPYHTYTYATSKPALEECLRGGIKEVIITLWGNDGCETNYMLGLPMLSVFSEYCWLGESCTEEDIWSISKFVTGMPRELAEAISKFAIGEKGRHSAGKLILWSDPLIDLITKDFDFVAAQEYMKQALETFEKYPDHPDIEYFKAVFRVALQKAHIRAELRNRYLADDRQWLKDFADNKIPQLLEDFEKLQKIHYESWHKDFKTHGFEQLMCRYGAAKERVKYAAVVINKYLAGELDQIAELEPEIFRVKPGRGGMAPEVMYIATR